MKIFLAGIVQGSIVENTITNQEYRERIKSILTSNLAGCEVYCPISEHPRSLEYDDREGRSTFFDHTSMAADADCVVAYVPEASMGSAIEMWEAYNNGHCVLTISPLVNNWVVRFLSDKVFATLEEFEAFVNSGDTEGLLWSEEAAEVVEVEEEEIVYEEVIEEVEEGDEDGEVEVVEVIEEVEVEVEVEEEEEGALRDE